MLDNELDRRRFPTPAATGLGATAITSHTGSARGEVSSELSEKRDYPGPHVIGFTKRALRHGSPR